jgi:hypothetical protein
MSITAKFHQYPVQSGDWSGIIRVRLHTNRGNPVISSEGESCAIQRSLKTDL